MCDLKITWIGQNGYILSDGKTTITIDPYLSDVVNRVAGRKRMVEALFGAEELKTDAIICTHNHLDHVDVDAIPLMNKENMLFLAPQDAENQLRECGVENFRTFDEGDVAQIGEFELEAVFSDHSVPSIGLIVKHSGIKMYFTGDTLYHKKLEDISECDIDIMFVCINGKLGNMNVDEAVKLTGIINPKVGVPTHYGMFESNTEDPEKYTSQVKRSFEMKYNKEYSVSEVINDV